MIPLNLRVSSVVSPHIRTHQAIIGRAKKVTMELKTIWKDRGIRKDQHKIGESAHVPSAFVRANKLSLKNRKQIRNSLNVMLPKNAVAKLGEEKDKRKHIVRTSHKRLTLGTNYNKENGIL